MRKQNQGNITMKKLTYLLAFLLLSVASAFAADTLIWSEGKDVYMPDATLMVGTSITTPDLTVTDDLVITDDLSVGGMVRPSLGSAAAAGSTQADAASISAQVSYVTATDNAKGVKFPTPTLGDEYEVFNTVSAKRLIVYPHTNGTINGGGANAPTYVYGLQGLRCLYVGANAWRCASLEQSRDANTLFIPAGTGRAGAAAGWVNTGTNINQATVAASQAAGTFTIPVTGLQVGDTIESFKVVGQIESAGNAVTLDADLRQLTNAAADPADASLGAITQVAVTADTAVAASKTLATAELIDSGDMPYVLLTATTAASTDIRLLGIEVVVRRAN